MSLAVLGVPGLLGSLSMVGLLYAPCGQSSRQPADYGLAAEPVTLQARAGGSFRGYFIPGTNGATIIMPPPYNSGRAARLPQAALLAQHGYGVFTFESRRCAGMGPLSLGYQEVAEVGDALAYLQDRPGVDPNRLGIHGFSSAGATAIMAAARWPALRAVVAEGGYGDFGQNALGPASGTGLRPFFMRLYQGAARGTYSLLMGHGLEKLSPVSVIDRIGPRPILLIYGSREISLPAGRQQLAAAGANATLWVVEGAGHGDYLQVASEAYEAHLVAFFDEVLLDQPSP